MSNILNMALYSIMGTSFATRELGIRYLLHITDGDPVIMSNIDEQESLDYK